MPRKFEDSIVLITGPRENGTGFIIHHNAQYTYLLTCAHVVDDVNSPVHIGNNENVEVVKKGDTALDVAVLRIARLMDRPVLSLSSSAQSGASFKTAGFRKFENTKTYKIEALFGQLVKQTALETREEQHRIPVWELKIFGNEKLQSGYSGSPVIDEATGKVVAIISYRYGEGKSGMAISIESLKLLWKEMPSGLLEEDDDDEAVKEHLPPRFLKTNYFEIFPDTLNLPDTQWHTEELTITNISSEDIRGVVVAFRPTEQVYLKKKDYMMGDLVSRGSTKIPLRIRGDKPSTLDTIALLRLTIYSDGKPPQRINNPAVRINFDK